METDMFEPLERIVLADEECRSRIAFAAAQSERSIASARAEQDERAAAAHRDATAEIENELARIEADGAARVAAKRAAADEYLKRISAAAEQRLEAAAELYAAIITGEMEENG